MMPLDEASLDRDLELDLETDFEVRLRIHTAPGWPGHSHSTRFSAAGTAQPLAMRREGGRGGGRAVWGAPRQADPQPLHAQLCRGGTGWSGRGAGGAPRSRSTALVVARHRGRRPEPAGQRALGTRGSWSMYRPGSGFRSPTHRHRVVKLSSGVAEDGSVSWDAGSDSDHDSTELGDAGEAQGDASAAESAALGTAADSTSEELARLGQGERQAHHEPMHEPNKECRK